MQKIWHEKVSGATRDRPELTRVMEYVREGDTLVVASMDRLARSVPDLYAIVEELNGRGVAVRFLKEEQRYDAHSVTRQASSCSACLVSSRSSSVR